MLSKSTLDQDKDVISDVTSVQVRLCASCERSLFHITLDNRVLCSTCCKYVYGWHALGRELQS